VIHYKQKKLANWHLTKANAVVETSRKLLATKKMTHNLQLNIFYIVAALLISLLYVPKSGDVSCVLQADVDGWRKGND